MIQMTTAMRYGHPSWRGVERESGGPAPLPFGDCGVNGAFYCREMLTTQTFDRDQRAIPSALANAGRGLGENRDRAGLLGNGESTRLDLTSISPGGDAGCEGHLQNGARSKLFEDWQLSHAIEALDYQVQRGSYVGKSAIYGLLRKCIAEKNLVLGSYLHALAVKCGYQSDTFLANHIICMYASHGRLEDAMHVFTEVAAPDRYMWASIILAHARHKQPTEAIRLYRCMRESTVKPDNHVFVAVLKACAAVEDLPSGIEVHTDILRTANKPNIFVGNCLLYMYAKCGSLEDARRVFDNLAARDVVTWNAMITAYTQHGHGQEALSLHKCMHQEGMSPANAVTFAGLLQACGSLGDLHQGKQLHAEIQERGLEADVIVGNCLVTMYAKCGSLRDARRVFNTLPTRDVVTWNAMITGYAQHGLGQEALMLYNIMKQESIILANPVTMVCLLQACGSLAGLEQGKEIHAEILQVGLKDTTPFVTNALIDMYSKCGSLEDARKVFDTVLTKDLVTWTSMIGGYARQGAGQEALTLFGRMQHESSTPADTVTYACVLEACASIGALRQGQQLHAQIRERGFELDVVVGTSLVAMYAKCGSLVDARSVFDDLPTKSVITWNTMIAGYAQQGLGHEALALHASMQLEGKTSTNCGTFACLLQACADIGALYEGKQLHDQIQERGLEADAAVGSSLVDMYAKCGSLANARRVFDLLPTRDVVTWTTMISGYVQHELGYEALSLYEYMQQEGSCSANHVTYMWLLQACASIGALQHGKQLHAQIQEKGLDAAVGSSLVNMYAKCGSLGESRRVFDSLPTRDVETWNALLIGYAENNETEMAVQCFEEMRQQGVKPNESTFTGLLVACSHGGLVHEGQKYFKMMVEDHHGPAATVNHYNCMVDLLGRSGHLDQAETLLQAMPFEKDLVGWTSLLNACKSHGDVERGVRCFESLLDLDRQNAAPYVLLCNIYANAGRWGDVGRIEKLRKSAGAKKKPAKAYIEVKKQVHGFTVGEDISGLSKNARSMNRRLREEGGHVPQTELVLKAMSEQEKEDALCGHAEKLALAYGLLNTPQGSALLVTKNLRMCNDCHSSTKVMSYIEKREVIVRDAHRVHRFVDGSCSCMDRH